MMSTLSNIFTRLNVFVYQVSHGHLGSQLGRQSILLLHTVGRRSGKKRITSLSYYRDGNNYLLVGSNWGKETHPAWFYNLMGQPHATIQVRQNTITVLARQAQGEEYQRLWQQVTNQNQQYVEYQSKIKRRLPIVILTPIDHQS
jgi:F420H(2)-dependent quinone reductase